MENTRINITEELREFDDDLRKWETNMNTLQNDIQELKAKVNTNPLYTSSLGLKQQSLELLASVKPKSKYHTYLLCVASYLYNQTIQKTSECMYTFKLEAVKNIVPEPIEFDTYVIGYILNLVHEIGGDNVLQTDYYDDTFDITVGLECIALYYFIKDPAYYVDKVLKALDNQVEFSDSTRYLDWNELEEVLNLDIYDYDEDITEEEFQQLSEEFQKSKFTETLVEFLVLRNLIVNIQEDGLEFDFSNFYA